MRRRAARHSSDRSEVVTSQPSDDRIAAQTWALGAAAVLACSAGLVIELGTWDPDPLALQGIRRTLHVATGASFFGAGLLQLVLWRVNRDPRPFQAGVLLVLLGFMAPWIAGFAHLLHDTQRGSTLSPLTTTLTAAATLLVGLTALARDWASPHGRPVLVASLVSPLLLALLVAPVFLSSRMIVEYGTSTTMLLEVGVAASWLTLAALSAARRRRTGFGLPGLTPALLTTLAVVWLLRAAAVVHLQPWSLAAALLLLGAGLVALAASAADLAATAEAEEERVLRTEEGMRAVAEAYEALDRQRQSVTHDARNVFLALRVASYALGEHGEQLSAGDLQRLRGSIAEEITHLEHLMTSSQPAEVVAFDTVSVVASVIDLERRAGLDVVAHLAPARAVGVPGDLARVVRNLLVNARSHAAGSTVTVEVRPAGSVVRIVVRDDGPGIPVPLRRTVYDRGSSRVDSDGSGLGLHISRALMQQQGGSLEHAEGPGARFLLTLPAAPSAATGATPGDRLHEHRAAVGAPQPR